MSRRKSRLDTPMPTTWHCGNCGYRHLAPTDKKCVVVASRFLQPEETSNDLVADPLCEAEIHEDLSNHASLNFL